MLVLANAYRPVAMCSPKDAAQNASGHIAGSEGERTANLPPPPQRSQAEVCELSRALGEPMVKGHLMRSLGRGLASLSPHADPTVPNLHHPFGSSSLTPKAPKK